MTTIHRTSGAHRAYMKGAPELVLERCTHVMDEGGPRMLEPGDRAAILAANEEMAKGALRVLGLASRDLPEGIACPRTTWRTTWCSSALPG